MTYGGGLQAQQSQRPNIANYNNDYNNSSFNKKANNTWQQQNQQSSLNQQNNSDWYRNELNNLALNSVQSEQKPQAATHNVVDML